VNQSYPSLFLGEASMSANILNRSFRPYTGEKARITRAYDYLILVLALFLFIGAFHLHFALTVGDWDFWIDLKDRQWWPLVTPLILKKSVEYNSAENIQHKRDNPIGAMGTN
jgi:hypothetical protein